MREIFEDILLDEKVIKLWISTVPTMSPEKYIGENRLNIVFLVRIFLFLTLDAQKLFEILETNECWLD